MWKKEKGYRCDVTGRLVKSGVAVHLPCTCEFEQIDALPS